jgi:transcriptional regulator with XRE-family HTH domain
MIQKEVGDTIRSARKSRGLTQRQLAELLGTTRVSVWKWENGHSLPTQAIVIDRIQEVLGVDLRTTKG